MPKSKKHGTAKSGKATVRKQLGDAVVKPGFIVRSAGDGRFGGLGRVKPLIKRASSPSRSTSSSEPDASPFMVATRYLVDGLVDVDAVVSELGVTKAALAKSLGLADETLQRFSRAAAPKTQARLREMLEILTRVEPWAGGMHQAVGWYRGQGIPALGDQTAEALVKHDMAHIVRSYLDGLAVGSFA